MICPDIGTVIGAAIGAGTGIVGSSALGDEIIDIGENVDGWVEDCVDDVNEFFEDAGDWDFISDIFNWLSS